MDWLSEKAFCMFRDWTKNASEKYPAYVFDIIDESLLVNDLKKTISSAVNSLKKKENEKRLNEGYDIGFLIGFINSNLNLQWTHEYIHKQSTIYKNFIALKAINNYFKLDRLTLLRINNVYKYLLLEDNNICGTDINIEKQVFKAYEIDLIPNEENDNDNLQIALQNVNKNVLVQMLDEEIGNFLPDTENYFTNKEIEQLLNDFQ